jgi:septal ring factor EnvC (AmiA/AmiB activator)
MTSEQKDSVTTMPQDWQSEATHTEWVIARTILTLGLPALGALTRKQYLKWRKRKAQHEAMLDGWSKVQEQITPAADDQEDLRKLADDARAGVRDARLKLITQSTRMTAVENRLDTLETTLVKIKASADERHTELVSLISRRYPPTT